MEEEKIKELLLLRDKIKIGGGIEKNEKRKQKNILTARERIEKLFDTDSFQEIGMHVCHNCYDFDMDKKEIHADAVISGIGNINDRIVAAFSQDFTSQGGTLGWMHSQKICDVMSQALNTGIPLVAFNDSGGARIQEGIWALSGYGQVFNMNVKLSGLVPQIAVIAGPCAGGAAYSPALCDFIIMTKKNSSMFICGPEVIKAATGQEVSMDEIGSANIHAKISGNIHFIVDNDEEAIILIKKILSYLPSNNLVDPPHDFNRVISLEINKKMNNIIPDKSSEAYDVKKIIKLIVDDQSFLEVQTYFAENLVIGFAKIFGMVVGIIANQPKIKAGTLDINASDKGARFIRFCDCFNIPLITLVDTPGFLPGINQEKDGIIRHGAKMLFAYSASTSAKITLILRKAYGGAYLAMCSKDMGADAVYVWPTAEIAVMGAEQAVKVLFKNKIKEAKNNNDYEIEKKLVNEYQKHFANPYAAAKAGMVSDIIDPGETRFVIARSLRRCLNKRTFRPPKKHGNIPL